MAASRETRTTGGAANPSRNYAISFNTIEQKITFQIPGPRRTHRKREMEKGKQQKANRRAARRLKAAAFLNGVPLCACTPAPPLLTAREGPLWPKRHRRICPGFHGRDG